MPQLDVTTYFSQLFWLGFFFILLLVISIRFMLPNMASIYHKRWEKIEGTQEQAQKLQHQAHEIQNSFEQHLAQVRFEAQNKTFQFSKELMISQEQAKSNISLELKDQLRSFEERLTTQKDVLKSEVQSMAQSLTTDIVQKIFNEPISSSVLEQSVHEVITKESVPAL